MLSRQQWGMVAALLSLVLAACSGPQTADPTLNPTAEPHPRPSPTPALSTPQGFPKAALHAQTALAEALHIMTDTVTITQVTPVQWSDACLGVALEGQMCAAVMTPGYRVVLEANGQRYEYHTDQSGNHVVLAAGPAADVPDIAVQWMLRKRGCQTARIGSKRIAFGPCGGVLLGGTWGQGVEDQRSLELEDFVSTLSTFEAKTRAGEVRFTGKGFRQAGPAEQRMVAEWAQLVYQEAEAGRSGAAWGLALAWSRHGGIAGFCDEVSVYITGTAFVSSCHSSPPMQAQRRWLSAAEMQQLYDWVDALQNFDLDHTDGGKPAAADAMAVRLTFAGQGTRAATEAEQQAIGRFAADLAGP